VHNSMCVVRHLKLMHLKQDPLELLRFILHMLTHTCIGMAGQATGPIPRRSRNNFCDKFGHLHDLRIEAGCSYVNTGSLFYIVF